MENIPIKIVAIPTEIAAAVRETGKAPRNGHPAYRDVAVGYGPCRHCLRAFVKGAEDRILFTFDQFQGIGQVPLPGPIFIHAAACERYPEDGGYPEGLRQYASVIDGRKSCMRRRGIRTPAAMTFGWSAELFEGDGRFGGELAVVGKLDLVASLIVADLGMVDSLGR